MKKTKFRHRHTGTTIRWKPDIKVFTDIDIPLDFYKETLRRQAVVNSGVKFVLKNEISKEEFEEFEFLYENGIVDYIKELTEEKEFTGVHYIETERSGRDREDLPEYKLKNELCILF